jgi:hypothetical protein
MADKMSLLQARESKGNLNRKTPRKEPNQTHKTLKTKFNRIKSAFSLEKQNILLTKSFAKGIFIQFTLFFSKT